MKKLALVLSLVLMLTFVGCSSKTTVKETDAFRFDSKTGYAYSTAPFGIDTTELEAASKRFTETFGAPAVQDDNGTGTQYLEWQDKSSGTALGLTYSDLGTTDPTLMISVFEKSRYVEAGTGEWK